MSRLPQLRRLPELRALPRAVAWYYARASALALRRDDPADALPPRPRELAATLELARGRRHVIVAGADCSWTAAALALDDAGRQVTAFRDSGWSPGDPFLSLLSSGARARIELVPGPVERLPGRVREQASMLVVDGEPAPEGAPAAVPLLMALVEPGGLVVLLRRVAGRASWVERALAQSGLEARRGPAGLLVWRKPLPHLSVPPPRRRLRGSRRRRLHVSWRRLATAALVIAGACAGVGLGALVTSGGGEGAHVSTTTATSEPRTATRDLPGTGQRGRESGSHKGRRAGGGRRSRSRARVRTGRRTRSRTARAVMSFTGLGARPLGAIRVRRRSVLSWKSYAGGLQIVSDALVLSEPGRSGTLPLSRGVYRRFRVTAPGRWTIRILPAGAGGGN